MKKEEFLKIRKKLDKTQKEMAALLGISIKTVESYEQGLRNIPVNVERIVYFLLFKLNMDKFQHGQEPPLMCWQEKNCPPQIRESCIAWLAQEGFFCWFITGRVCTGARLASGGAIKSCFHCDFFKKNLDKI